MSVTFSHHALLVSGQLTINLGTLLSTSSGNTPEYLVLVGLDRDRYPAGAPSQQGKLLSGDGLAELRFSAPTGSDSATLGIVFVHTAQGYYNTTYGYLDQMILETSGQNFHSEYLSLYGFGNAGSSDDALYARLKAELAKPFFDSGVFGYPQHYPEAVHLGTLDIVTRSNYVDATPDAATPHEIAAVASSFVGQAWNDNGCWVLASDIAASAGAALPLTSNETLPGLAPPVANGGWIVAYNSATASSSAQNTWQSQLRAGDIVVANDSCGGHVATVVSGAGNAALFIDNNGEAAGPGAPNDIIIGAAASKGPWNFPDLHNIVIYRLDTPVISVLAPLCLAAGETHALAPLFSVSDPAGKAIVSYQFYDTGNNTISVGAAASQAHSAATAVTVSAAALADARFNATAGGASDTLMVRASNGSYWGDWQAIDVAIGSSVQPAQLHAVAETLYLHGGASTALAPLFALDSPASPVTSYTIVQSPFGGTIAAGSPLQVSGQTASGDNLYEVSAADFAKLTFTAGIYPGAETISVSAHNGALLPSVTATVALANLAPLTQGLSHWVAPGTQIPLSALMAVTLQDANPVTSYLINTDVIVLDNGGMTEVQGTLRLNGAIDLLAGSGAPEGSYQIAAADLGKVTYQAASSAGFEFLQVGASDGGVGASGSLMITTTPNLAAVTAHPHVLADGQVVAAASLFDSAAAAPQYYRFFDPAGGGLLRLDSSATNYQSKGDTTPGVFIIAAADLSKLSYTAGGADESLLVSTAADTAHWSAEAALPVTLKSPVPHAMSGGAGADRLQGTSGNDLIDGSAGIDIVVEAGARANFSVVRGAEGWTVSDRSGAQGRDVLSNVERIVFDDSALALDTGGSAGQVYRLYKAAFDRLPDMGGLGWWIRQADHGMSMRDVAGFLVESPEFTSLYGAQLSDAGMVSLLYQNVLHRPLDQAGSDYWVHALQTGVARADVLAYFAESGENIAQVVGLIDNGITFVIA